MSSSDSQGVSDTGVTVKLNAHNSQAFINDFSATAKYRGLWEYYTREEKQPIPDDPAAVTAAERKELKTWRRERNQAAGLLWKCLEPSQQSHVSAPDVKEDPARMWDALMIIHRQKRPANRHHAFQALFSITQGQDETLTDVAGRVNQAMVQIKAARPANYVDSAGNTVKYTLEDQDQDLEVLAMIRAVNALEHGHFISSLTLRDDLAIDKVQLAFQNEDVNIKQRETQAAAYAQILANAAAANAAQNPTPTSSSSSDTKCDFCHYLGHLEKDCRKKLRAQASARERRPSSKAKDKAKEAATQASTNPSSPPSYRWNTDTGATSHMTPHRKWFTTYRRHRVPIRLADSSVVFSEGIGTILFAPTGGDAPIEFTDTLHVPSLHNNLFAVLRLSKVHGYKIEILGSTMMFINPAQHARFSATITSSNIGYLDGETITLSNAEACSMAQSTLPHNEELWHRRLAHTHMAVVRTMRSKNLVNGLEFTSNTPADPICEPCIAGKLRRHNIPRSPSFRPLAPLVLIHSDLKGPMPVRSRQGSFYWITFICAFLDYWTLDFLSKKSDALESFKRFVNYMERFHGLKVKTWRQDKGGEFIGKNVDAYLRQTGIQREDTEPDEPHQNGLAERANRTIAEGATAALSESRLAPFHWQDAAAHFVNVRNMCTSTRSPDITPYENLHKRKPDVSKLRVFGCLAYLFVKKKHRKALQSHSRRVVFIGYPQHSAGYLFWDSASRKQLISSHAIFDERVFPGGAVKIINPFGDIYAELLAESIAASPQLEAHKESAYTPDIHQGTLIRIPELPPVLDRGGEIITDPNTGIRTPPASRPTSPLAPQIESPPGSPIQSLPPLSPLSELTDLPPSQPPSPPPSPPPVATRPLAPNEPPTDRNGMIIPPPDTGRGFRRAAPRPWNYNGATWPTEQASLANEPGNDDEPVLTEEDISQGINFVLGQQSTENSPFSPPDAAGSFYEYMTVEAAVNLARELTSSKDEAASSAQEPRTLKEALKLPTEEATKWHDAAVLEMQALVENGVFEVVRRPRDRIPIGSRWVFKVKRNADGTIERYKARLVAKGYSMRPGFDYNETFSPTPKWAAIRAVLALAALESLELWSVDISTAFLNGELQEDVYMEQPEGFEENGREWVWKLKRALYGLKQAGREWHRKLHQVLTEILKFHRVRCDHSIWVYNRNSDASRIIVPVFVDDMTIATKSSEAREKLINDLRSHFKLRDLGPTTWLLGVEIKRDTTANILTANQSQFSTQILERASMQDCNSAPTPIDPKTKLSTAQCPKEGSEEQLTMLKRPYRMLLGAIAYLAIATRPDLAYTVGVLARFSHNPGEIHWNALKRLLRYLKGTIHFGLRYSRDEATAGELFASYSDADHGGNPDNGRSTSGFVIMMGTGAISWASRLQAFVTISTTEAEYVSGVTIGQEIIWLRNLFTEFGHKLKGPSRLRIDNQSALSVAKNPDHHGRVKHLDLRYYWLRDEVERGTISVEHLRTDNMPADVLTKALSPEKFRKFREMMGVVDHRTAFD